jgi:hypothetical protein
MTTSMTPEPPRTLVGNPARERRERTIGGLFLAAALVSVAITIFIVLTVLGQAVSTAGNPLNASLGSIYARVAGTNVDLSSVTNVIPRPPRNENSVTAAFSTSYFMISRRPAACSMGGVLGIDSSLAMVRHWRPQT